MINNMINIYLSSTSYHWWNLRSYFWKHKFIKQIYKFPFQVNVCFYDPLVFKSEDPSVCPKDIKMMNVCDYIVCYIDKITIGTLLELGYNIFKSKKKKLFVLSFNKSVVNHPWFVYLCKDRIFNNYFDCCQAIYSDFVKGNKNDEKSNSTI